MIKSFLNIQTFKHDYCEFIINSIKNSNFCKSGVYNEPDSQQFRTSSSINVLPTLSLEIEKRIDFCVNFHTKNLFKLKYIEPIQFLKYDHSNSGHFSKHTDSEYFNSDGVLVKSAPNRFISTVTYLNDNYDGGELVLHFTRCENNNPLCFKPNVGSTILFHSNINYPHEVLPVTKGIRYSIVKWYGLDETIL